MGLRDLLGVRKPPEANKASSSSSSGVTNVLNEEVPSASSSAVAGLDSEPVTAEFTTPANMIGGDLKGMGMGGGGARGGANPPYYNPYSGLGGPFDPDMSKALYSLSDAPEFLFDEERRHKKRSWSENLTFTTGVGYLGGTIAGGGLGAYHGVRSAPEAGLLDTSKLKLNRVLNASGARGASLGNSCGCLGLYYAVIESLAGYYTDYEYDTLVAILAGAGAGSMYKSMQGRRAMAVYGAVGAGLSAAHQAGHYVTEAVSGR